MVDDKPVNCWVVFGSVLVVVLVGGYGCKRSKTLSAMERDAADECRRLSMRGLPNESSERAKFAQARWENGTLDAEPILIDAMLTIPKGEEKPVIVLALSDEEEDVLGIVISEQHSESAEAKTYRIQEQYPIYTGTGPFAVSHEIIPVTIRTARERKDDVLWRDYVQRNTFAPERLPPIWVSMPAPNVRVQVSIYDVGGRMSAPVDLREVK